MRIDRAEKDGLVLERDQIISKWHCRNAHLVHSGIGKEQSGIIEWNGRRGWYEGVFLGPEEIEELVANSNSGPRTVLRLGRHGMDATPVRGEVVVDDTDR